MQQNEYLIKSVKTIGVEALSTVTPSIYMKEILNSQKAARELVQVQ